ncbi:MAG: magnesium/cobalt transporter CorA [Clostridiaceae bacterium]
MIRVIAITKDLKPILNLSVEELNKENILWFWLDMNQPLKEEISILENYFKFHHLAIEDCVYSLNSPKLNYYDDYNFFVLNSLNQDTLVPKEVALFVGTNYIVSYHNEHLDEIDEVFERTKTNEKNYDKGPTYLAHQIFDKIVDSFFPAIYKIEDKLNKFENNTRKKSTHILMNEIFKVRGELLKLRKIVVSMRDLLYRIVNSERLKGFYQHKLYFTDIHDHLIKLSNMVESNREITSDIRDSYLSLNATRMNRNMMVLTVITTIFIPLTFIAGVYGMNFEYMPELTYKYGYFIVLFIMTLIAIVMFSWFKRKGWFDD